MRIQIVSAWIIACQREIVSQPPKKILSTATAEPGDMLEKVTHMRLTIHQEYTRCHEPGKRGLGTEFVSLSTRELYYLH